MVTDPDHPVVNRWRADCPSCGDHSRPVEIRGGVSIGATDHVFMKGADAIGDTIYLRTGHSRREIAR